MSKRKAKCTYSTKIYKKDVKFAGFSENKTKKCFEEYFELSLKQGFKKESKHNKNLLEKIEELENYIRIGKVHNKGSLEKTMSLDSDSFGKVEKKMKGKKNKEGNKKRRNENRPPRVPSGIPSIPSLNWIPYKKESKEIQSDVWICKHFPISIDQFLPLLDIISDANPNISKLKQFIKSLPTSKSSNNEFPLKVICPIFYTVKAQVNFANLSFKYFIYYLIHLENKLAMIYLRSITLMNSKWKRRRNLMKFWI